jgi:hypothetical protein
VAEKDAMNFVGKLLFIIISSSLIIMSLNYYYEFEPHFQGGYCLALDMTARDFQKEAKTKGLPWTMAKVKINVSS